MYKLNLCNFYSRFKSVFIRQHTNFDGFSAIKSWTILSPIEKRIKEKIERIGTPLKDWDVTINYGIKTGLNEAFIIDGEKRRELIAADPKSEEIIRPILRGRDIQRYQYYYANQWLIAFFPSKNYDVEDFKAIKRHLLTFGKDLLINAGYSWVAESYLEEWCYKRLEQSGENIIINGIRIKFSKNEVARKATNNKWFETQDSISYWEDFFKQKIVWGNLNLNASYAIAPEGYFVNAPCPMIVPASKYLLAILNSNLADYFVRSLGVTRNGGYFEYKPMFIEQLPVPIISIEQQRQLTKLIEKIENLDNKLEIKNIEKKINDIIYTLYDLTNEEISMIALQ